IYIETFRNIPPLLQIFFWYFAVFLPLPGPRQSLSLGDTFFLSNRGLNMPAPTMAEGFWPFLIAVVVALVAIWLLARWAMRRFEATGRSFPTLITSLVLIVVLPALAMLAF